MKQILLSIIALISIHTIAYSQACTPVNPSPNSLSPDSATNLKHACAGKQYDEIINIHIIKDTSIAVTTPIAGTITANIDSFVISATIAGMPSYIAATSFPAPLAAAGASFPKSNFSRMVIKGDSLGCVKLSGMVPGATAAGNTNLTITTRVYLSNMHSTNALLEVAIPTQYPGRKVDTLYDITFYKFVVDAPGTGACIPAATSNMEKYGFDVIGAVPNPASNYTTIQFVSDKAATYATAITDMTGNIVFTNKVASVVGKNYIPVHTKSFAKGMYMYTLQSDKQSISKKLIIE